jgi:hypothetical protein
VQKQQSISVYTLGVEGILLQPKHARDSEPSYVDYGALQSNVPLVMTLLAALLVLLARQQKPAVAL